MAHCFAIVQAWRDANTIGKQSARIALPAIALRSAPPSSAKQNRGGRKRYDWAAVQRYYDDGHTYKECKARFGFASQSWQDAVNRRDIAARGHRWPLEKLLPEGRNASTLKRRLIDAGLLRNECSSCGLSEWQGKKLCVQIDHINGINTDNRLENLRMLCPNCHSQTDTFGARNKLSIRKSRAESAALTDTVAPAGFEPALPT